ncbi:MAG: hypothetical protein ACYC7D_07515 [Nitrososphaerales archaeon]
MSVSRILIAKEGNKVRRRVIPITVTTIVLALVDSMMIPALATSERQHRALPTVLSTPSPLSHVNYYGQNGAKSFSTFFQTIRGMTIEFNTTSGNTRSYQIISYDSRIAAMVDGSVAYMVNMTGTEHTGNLTDADSALVWIDAPTSNIVLVSSGQKHWTGTYAQQEAGILTFITTNIWLSLLNSTTVAPLVTNRTVNIGSTQLLSSTYQSFNTLPWYQKLVVTVGSIPQTGMQLVLASDYIVPGGGPYSFRVLSLELN